MSLLDYKWITAGVIALLTLLAGFASLHFIKRYQRFLQMGDAFADGIFLGVAAFHLFPDAIHGLASQWTLLPAIVLAFLLCGGGFILLFFLERWIIDHEVAHFSTSTTPAWILAGILSVHAFITGAALGMADTTLGVTVLFLAIIMHKAFESFALAIGLHRRWKHRFQTKVILLCFTFMTPLGIGAASLIAGSLQTATADLLTSIFSAFASGTFLYIGTLHATHNHFDRKIDPTHRYYKFLATFAGIVVMGGLSLWV